MKIIEYINAKNIIVKFLDEYKTNIKTSYEAFLRGNVKNPYDKTVYNNGYIGVDKYNPLSQTIAYNCWRSMLQRCYSEKMHYRCPTYNNCTVCKEWLNFQNFAKWHEENYYNINNEVMNLDKDILIKGNKVYSPETCVFVPRSINLMFVKSNKTRGDLPIGVSKNHNKFMAQVALNKGFLYLGTYDNYEKAFQAYKIHKEQLIKNLAKEYKNNIPEKLYNIMNTYEVEITD